MWHSGYCLGLPLFLSLVVGSDPLSKKICCGRCTAANVEYSQDREECVAKCCANISVTSMGYSFPVGCPLRNYTHCSVSTPLRAPDLSIENETGLLLFNTTALEKGISLYTLRSNESVPSRESQVVIVKSVHLSSQRVYYQLLYAGKENVLDLNTTECYNVSIAIIKECGVSNFSKERVFPRQEPFTLKSVTLEVTALQDTRPNITALWKVNGSLPDGTLATISLVQDGSYQDCVTASKVVKASKGAVSFLPKDFSNNSVWNCFYDVNVSVSYLLPCMFGNEKQAQTKLEESVSITLPNTPVTLNVTKAEAVWNPSNLTFSINLVWVVPQIYDMHKHVNFFIIINKVFAKVKTINATGDLVYTATLEGIQPMKSFKFYIDTKSNQGSIALKAISIPGKPPTAVSNITVNNNGSHFVVNWDEPVKTNGPISSYTAYLLLHGEKGTIVARESNSTTSTHYAFLVREYLGDGKATISFNVTATNMFGTSPSAGITRSYEYDPTVRPPPSDVGGVIAGVLSAVIVLGIAVVVVIIIVISRQLVCAAKKQDLARVSETFNGVPKDIMEINEDSYKLYFKRLPPAMVDRWVIPLHMFNTSSFHLLGEGNFSSVYFSLVRGPLSTPTQLDQFRNYSEESIAVKLLKGGASEKEMEAFLNEAEILKTLSTQSCPYVVQLVGLQLEHAPPMIAMELVPCGNLLNILRSSCLADDDEEPESLLAFALPKHPRNLARRQTLVEFQRDRAKSIDSYCQLRSYSLQSDSLNLPVEAKISVKASQLLKFAIQAIRGMEHLQLFGILHRDLACRNLLLSANGIIKISDFGFACFLDGKSEVVAELPTDSKPLRWMSPEAFENDVYSEASDVWSFGVTLWEVFSQGKFPYPTLSDADVLEAVKAGSYLECPENCDKEVYNLMLNCWMLNPNDRPTFSALKTTVESFMYDLYPYLQPEL